MNTSSITHFDLSPFDSSEMFAQMSALQSLVQSQTDPIVIRLGGASSLLPSQALLFSDLVMFGRSKGVQVIIDTMVPLYGATCLTWLVGTHRTIYPSGYLYLYSIDALHRQNEVLFHERSRLSSSHREQEMEDYETVLSRINEYLEVATCTDRRISSAELRTLNLLDTPKLHEMSLS